MINLEPRTLAYIYRFLPNFLWPLKWYLKKISLGKVGDNFQFSHTSRFRDHRLIKVGNNVHFGPDTLILTVVNVIIGDHVMFGPNVTLIGGDHNMSEIGKPMRQVQSLGQNQPIVIENDVWVGTGSIILKGVTIGEGSIIGAGSVVTKSLPPYSVCLGNPCQKVKNRFSVSDLSKHIRSINSKYTIDQLKKILY